MEIKSVNLHSADMIRCEISDMVNRNGFKMTIGIFMTLVSMSSPMISGRIADIGDIDIFDAKNRIPELSGIPDDLVPFVIFNGLTLCSEVFELIQNSDSFEHQDDGFRFSPEWLMNIFGMCCKVNPALTWTDFLWEIPMTAVAHLAVASIRFNGKKTPRPEDFSGAFDELKKMSD